MHVLAVLFVFRSKPVANLYLINTSFRTMLELRPASLCLCAVSVFSRAAEEHRNQVLGMKQLSRGCC